MIRSVFLSTSAALLACGACSKPAPAPEPTASEAVQAESSAAPIVAEADPTPTGMPSGSTTGIPEFGIPVAVQGRWGLVPADCTSTRGDAKGLMIVSATTLTFYESRGTLKQIAEQSDTRLRANFAFSGEGMTWTRDELLDVQGGGKTLVRREYGEEAAPGPFKYARCPN